MSTIRTVVATASVCALATGAYLTLAPAHAQPAPMGPSITGHRILPLTEAIPEVAERTVHSVVSISATSEVQGHQVFSPFGDFGPGMYEREPQRATSLGSGVIVSQAGRIITNAHVIANADEIKVTLFDGREHDVKVVGADRDTDIAVLQIQGAVGKLEPLALGDSTKLRLGEVVLAIGNPMGLSHSVSMGIVSAKDRGGLGIETFENFIQTDAAINQGNSGGALVNLRGELVGINTAIFSKSGGNQGIGFAIPTAMMQPVADMLVRDGKVTRGYLGLVVRPLNASVAEELGLPISKGVLIEGVEAGGPAQRAGLAQGDIVTAINGSPITQNDKFVAAIANLKPGTAVRLDVVKAGKTSPQAITATLSQRPAKSKRPIRRR